MRGHRTHVRTRQPMWRLPCAFSGLEDAQPFLESCLVARAAKSARSGTRYKNYPMVGLSQMLGTWLVYLKTYYQTRSQGPQLPVCLTHARAISGGVTNSLIAGSTHHKQ